MFSTNKRKAPDDETNSNSNGVMNTSTMTTTATNNPLVNAAKKAKREAKRKLANAEEAPGGLLIVRTQVNPSSSLPPAAPIAKKFKSSSQPLPSTSRKPPSKSKSSSLIPSSQPASLTRYHTPDADPALDAAVRAMDTEAADLRRSSRTPQTPAANASRLRSRSSTNIHPKSLHFPAQKETIIDVSAPLPAEEDETPKINRNKRLRAGAMAAIASGSSDVPMDVDIPVDPITPPRRPGQSAPGSHRRKSSVGRGKRVSSVITQPHNSVAESSFYRHIDIDLPDSERIQQLFIWCSARVASTPSSSPSTSTSSPSSSPLPTLSEEAEAALKATQHAIVRKLAERRVDLSLFGKPNENEKESGANVKLAENKQNVTNQTWEGVYSRDIQSAIREEEAWKQVSSAYDAYARRVRNNIEKRRADLGISTPTPTPGTDLNTGAGTPSAKGQGKQRAPNFEPHEPDLPPSFQAGLRMVKKVLARSRPRRKALLDQHQDQTPGAGPSTATQKGADPDSRPLPASSQRHDRDVEMEMEEDAVRKEAEAEMEADKIQRARMRDVEFKLDHLYVMASQARQTTEVAQLALDSRFEVLARALDARHGHPSHSYDSASTPSESSVFGRYVRSGASGSGGGDREREEADEALALLRALARIDSARPPAQVGDAARRAVREVQRVVGDAGGMGIGERRITEVPAGVGLTPRKMPGTPRRGTTPSRER